MAGMIETVPTGAVKILDAGAGAGILAFAAAKRCFELGSTNIQLVAYELDSAIILELRDNMANLGSWFMERGIEFHYEIREKDFVLDRQDIRRNLR